MQKYKYNIQYIYYVSLCNVTKIGNKLIISIISEDPEQPENNVGRSLYGVLQVKHMFDLQSNSMVLSHGVSPLAYTKQRV